MATMEGPAERRIEALVERAEDRGCVNLSELTEVAQELDLPDDDVQALHERLETRGIEISDDCANDSAPGAHYNN